jgi:hypothetical protein
VLASDAEPPPEADVTSHSREQARTQYQAQTGKDETSALLHVMQQYRFTQIICCKFKIN